MRLRVDQLDTHLNKSGLAPVYLLSGDEPLQMMEAEDGIRQYARQQGIEERVVLNVDKSFDWNQLAQESANLSLFSSQRLLELRMASQKPGKPGSDAIVSFCENPAADTTLLISCERLDKKAQQVRWFKAVDKLGAVIQIWPVEPTKLPGWIINRMKQMGKHLDKDAAEFIAQRTEGNLLAARQELEKLCLLVDKQNVQLPDVLASVVDSARHDVFALTESVFLNNPDRVATMLRGLKKEGSEPIAIFGAIMWEFRRVCSMANELEGGANVEQLFGRYRIWPQRKNAINAVLKRFNAQQMNQLLNNAMVVDRSLKGAIRHNPWELLENFLFRIAGVKLQPLPAK